MKYEIYFQDMIEWLDDLDEKERPNGEKMIYYGECERFFNHNLKFRQLDENFQFGTTDKYGDNHMEVECWLAFEAKNHEEAIKTAPDVLENAGFEWVDVYYILVSQDDNNLVVEDHTGLLE